jgi:hypothetical protein
VIGHPFRGIPVCIAWTDGIFGTSVVMADDCLGTLTTSLRSALPLLGDPTIIEATRIFSGLFSANLAATLKGSP